MQDNIELEIEIDSKEFKEKLNLKDGKTPIPGVDFPIPKNGLPGEKGGIGEKGDPGKNGSPDLPIEIKNKLESLKGEERLDHSAIKGLDIFQKELKAFMPRSLFALYDVNVGTPLNNQSLIYDSASNKWKAGTVSTTPAGSNTQVQFNNSGVFGADSTFTKPSNSGPQIQNATTSGTPGTATTINTGDPNTKGLILKGARNVGVQPNTISGLQYWFKADSESYTDGQTVATLTDRSGNALNGTGFGTLTFKTNIVNGQSVYRFDGSTAYATVAHKFDTNSTVFIVLKRASKSSPSFQHLIEADGAGNTQVYMGGSSDNTVIFTSSAITATTNINTSNWTILAYDITGGTTANLYANDNLIGTTTPNSARGSTTTYIGRYNGGSTEFLNADIAEIIVYNSVLSSTDRQNVEGYLSNKYGISIAVNQQSNLLEIQDYLAAINGFIAKDGRIYTPALIDNSSNVLLGFANNSVGVGTLTPDSGTQMTVPITAVTNVGLRFKKITSQTSNFLEILDTDSLKLGGIDSTGRLFGGSQPDSHIPAAFKIVGQGAANADVFFGAAAGSKLAWIEYDDSIVKAAIVDTYDYGAGAGMLLQIGNNATKVGVKVKPTGNGFLQVLAGGTTSTPAKVGGVIFDHFADAGNGTTVETDLYSDTLPASIFQNNGDKLSVVYGGTFVSSASATRQLKVYVGGTLVFDSGALSISAGSDAWAVYVEVIRDSSSSVRCITTMNTTGAATNAYCSYTTVTGLTLSNTQIIKITGTAAGVGAATNDIVAKQGYIEWKSAA